MQFTKHCATCRCPALQGPQPPLNFSEDDVRSLRVVNLYGGVPISQQTQELNLDLGFGVPVLDDNQQDPLGPISADRIVKLRDEPDNLIIERVSKVTPKSENKEVSHPDDRSTKPGPSQTQVHRRANEHQSDSESDPDEDLQKFIKAFRKHKSLRRKLNEKVEQARKRKKVKRSRKSSSSSSSSEGEARSPKRKKGRNSENKTVPKAEEPVPSNPQYTWTLEPALSNSEEEREVHSTPPVVNRGEKEKRPRVSPQKQVSKKSESVPKPQDEAPRDIPEKETARKPPPKVAHSPPPKPKETTKLPREKVPAPAKRKAVEAPKRDKSPERNPKRNWGRETQSPKKARSQKSSSPEVVKQVAKYKAPTATKVKSEIHIPTPEWKRIDAEQTKKVHQAQLSIQSNLNQLSEGGSSYQSHNPRGNPNLEPINEKRAEERRRAKAHSGPKEKFTVNPSLSKRENLKKFIERPGAPKTSSKPKKREDSVVEIPKSPKPTTSSTPKPKEKPNSRQESKQKATNSVKTPPSKVPRGEKSKKTTPSPDRPTDSEVIYGDYEALDYESGDEEGTIDNDTANAILNSPDDVDVVTIRN